MRNALIDILGGTEGLFLSGGSTVDRRVDAPEGSVVVGALQAHQVLILCPVAAALQPQALVHGLQRLLRLFFVISGILAQNLGNTGCEFKAAIVVG